MTPEHLDLIRQVYDAMNRRDVEALRRFGGANPQFSWASSADRERVVSLREYATLEEARVAAASG